MIARYGASLGRICFGINGAYNVALATVLAEKKLFQRILALLFIFSYVL